MTEDNLDTPTAADASIVTCPAAETLTKQAAAKQAAAKQAEAKAKPKPIAKPKPVTTSGPVYLLLFANGKYKELREAELNSEAASVLKDPSLRLIKGQILVPQISFKSDDE